MPTVSKDKRTKEQLLQILSNALTQEEQLGAKIKALEHELAVCRKENEDSRAEISQYGLSSSKVSFRIDYYKTTENGRLKGIIEHLATRQKKSFKGLGFKLLAQFMEPFLPEQTAPEKSVAVREAAPAAVQEEVPAIQAEKTVGIVAAQDFPRNSGPSLADRLRAQLKDDLGKAGMSVPVKDQTPIIQPMVRQQTVLNKVPIPNPAGQELNSMGLAAAPKMVTKSASSLLERLRIEFQNRNKAVQPELL